MLAKGRPPTKTMASADRSTKFGNESWGSITEADAEMKQLNLSSNKVDDYMAVPKLKKSRTLRTKKYDVGNYVF